MSEEKVIAVVAGEEITQKEFDLFLENLPDQQRAYAANPQFRKQVLDRLVAIHLFTKAGEDEKMDESLEFQVVLAQAKKDLLAQYAMQQAISNVSVSDEEIAAFYDANQARFKTEPSVSAKHILVSNEEKCAEVLSEINAGTISFEDAAKKYSTCPSKERGGDLGKFGKGQMVKEFETAAFEAEIGQIVGPVKTQFGAHLIKVEEKNEGKIASLDEVKGQIAKHLLAQKQNDAYEARVNELTEKYGVKINE